MAKEIFIAAAWPYANGSLHLGHVAGLIGADILARYFRLCGKSVLFVSGSDCHGTPIALEADRQGVDPAVIADKYHNEFVKTLIDGMSFSYDCYTTTTTKEHYKLVQEIFSKLYREGNIYTKTEELPYCRRCQRFLPDRYIEGECPICHFDSARGDQCDNCGNLVDVKKLIKPRCKICGSLPEWRESEHFFLRLSAFQGQLKKWVADSVGWRPNAKNFSTQLLNQGLIDRAITRDTTWGVPIPLDGYSSKRIYVWFEAVCGYLSASREWATSVGRADAWKKFWQGDKAFHYYVHGKDNIPFHSIIWPTILLAYGRLHLPDRIFSSEYLTLEKKQFSKSRHWAVWLPDFLGKFDSETLRYYLVTNGPETADADFSWEGYRAKTNTELIGKFGNYIYRILSFIHKNFPGGVKFPRKPDERANEFVDLAKKTFSLAGPTIEKGHFRAGLRQVIKLVEYGNKYINDVAPWVTIKTDREKAEHDLAIAVQVIKCLAILIAPFLPKSSKKICNQLGLGSENLKWEYPPPKLITVRTPRPLYQQIEEEIASEQHSLLGK